MVVGNKFAFILASRKFVDWTHLSAKLYKGNVATRLTLLFCVWKSNLANFFDSLQSVSV